MFTGLVEELGTVLQTRDEAEGRRILIRAARVADGMVRGDSISVNGACQTVSSEPTDDRFEVVAVGETLRRTNLGSLRPGSQVNLERPLRIGDRLGGHWVNGHVDATTPVLGIRRTDKDRLFRIGLPGGLVRYVVEKGSIAVDGVSLTVGEVGDDQFHVYVIPETWERTLFGAYRVGDHVNLEVDILAKYVERALGRGASADSSAGEGGWASAGVRRIVESWSGDRDGHD